jgi:hypothetical protein
MRNCVRQRLPIAVLLALASAPAVADVFIVAHPSVKISGAEVIDVFKGEKQLSGAVKLVPVDNSAAQDEFLKKVLGMERTRYESLWTKKSFREGLNPPAVKSGDAAMVEFVRSTPGAVGYLTGSPLGLQIIQRY